jgi:hypothetical protein
MYGLKTLSERSVMKSFISKTCKKISSKEVLEHNPVINQKPKFQPWQKEEFKKEFCNTHWLSHYTDKIRLWWHAPFNLGIWNTDKDTELGRYSWNTNAYNNSLSNILYRNEKLQTREIMNAARRFDHRFSLSINKAEEPPRITPNSVFLYRDSSYTMINRRTVEKFALLMVVSMAWNPSSLVMYAFLGWYFQLITKNYFASLCNVIRMDLLPNTEQIHMIKVGVMGFPRSCVVNVNDLVKIDKDEDPYCKNIFIFLFKIIQDGIKVVLGYLLKTIT